MSFKTKINLYHDLEAGKVYIDVGTKQIAIDVDRDDFTAQELAYIVSSPTFKEIIKAVL